MNLEEILNSLERKYGGLVQGVMRNVLSENEGKRYQKSHQGGDRMNSKYHNYSKVYSKFMANRLDDNINFAEVGILTGSGMAIWCDLFKNATIYGLDIDTNIFYNNKSNLESLGAFKHKQPIVNSFDQYKDNTEYLAGLLKNDKKFSIVIDDGCHEDGAILKCLESFLPHLEKDFIYFIEDNRKVHKTIMKKYPQFNVFYSNQMTVLTPK
jgi:hypothetical protein